jgi:hypothetical protein
MRYNISVHLYLTGPPIYLRVVIFQPGVTEDEILSPEASYAEECSFGVAVVT